MEFVGYYYIVHSAPALLAAGRVARRFDGYYKDKSPATAGVHTYTYVRGPGACRRWHIRDGGDAPPPAAPTVSITGNGKPRAVTVEPGDPVDIEALFTAGTEALAASAINGCLTPNKSNEDVNCQTPVNSQGALGKKNYSFTPSAEGKYYFYPVVRTASLGWNDYGKKLTVTADCPASTKFKNGRCEPNLCIGAFDHATLCTGDADDVPGRTNSQLKDACSAAATNASGRAPVWIRKETKLQSASRWRAPTRTLSTPYLHAYR